MKNYKVNEGIEADEVRLISSEGQQLGVFSKSQALEKAIEEDNDLIAVDMKAEPPVCKLGNYGKFKYQQEKREKQAKKNQSRIETKEVQLRPVTEEHDKKVKIKQINKFLEKGNKVKLVIKFKGRETTHKEKGQNVLNELIQSANNASIETSPTDNGKTIFAVLVPQK